MSNNNRNRFVDEYGRYQNPQNSQYGRGSDSGFGLDNRNPYTSTAHDSGDVVTHDGHQYRAEPENVEVNRRFTAVNDVDRSRDAQFDLSRPYLDSGVYHPATPPQSTEVHSPFMTPNQSGARNNHPSSRQARRSRSPSNLPSLGTTLRNRSPLRPRRTVQTAHTEAAVDHLPLHDTPQDNVRRWLLCWDFVVGTCPDRSGHPCGKSHDPSSLAIYKFYLLDRHGSLGWRQALKKNYDFGVQEFMKTSGSPRAVPCYNYVRQDACEMGGACKYSHELRPVVFMIEEWERRNYKLERHHQ